MSVIFIKILLIRYGQTKVLKRLFRDRFRRLEEFSDFSHITAAEDVSSAGMKLL